MESEGKQSRVSQKHNCLSDQGFPILLGFLSPNIVIKSL